MKVNFGAIVSEGRGSIGGTTFSRNRGGAYSRNRTIPTDPATAAQIAQRARFATISASWATLTDAQRNTWQQAVSEYVYTDVFGKAHVYSPFVLFQQCNLNLLLIGSTMITEAVPPQEKINYEGLTITATSVVQDIVINTGISQAGPNQATAYYATPMYSPGISYVKNKFRYMNFIPAEDPTQSYGFNGEYSAVFGLLVAGFKVSVMIRMINTLSGEASSMITASTIIIP